MDDEGTKVHPKQQKQLQPNRILPKKDIVADLEHSEGVPQKERWSDGNESEGTKRKEQALLEEEILPPN